MKSKDRQEIFKDERTIQIEHKIGNELAFLAIILLLLSIFVKLLYLKFHPHLIFMRKLLFNYSRIFPCFRVFRLRLKMSPGHFYSQNN